MASLLRHARLGWIALAAIVGVLSSAGGASAGAMGGGSGHGGDCCAARPMDDCGCCTAPAPSRAARGGEPAAVVEDRALTRSATLRHGTRPCVCRAEDPAAPASKGERPTSERRQSSERTFVCEVLQVVDEQPSPFATRRLLPGSSPPRAPLYLRTLRLLI